MMPILIDVAELVCGATFITAVTWVGLTALGGDE